MVLRKSRLLALTAACIMCVSSMLGGCAGSDSSSLTEESSSVDRSSQSDNDSRENESPDSEALPDESGGAYEREKVTLSDLDHPAGDDSVKKQEVWTEQEQSGLFSAASGVYEKPFELVLSGAPDGGEIYYTLDGSDPAVSDSAEVYRSPISITDRKGDRNVVSAVEPIEISGAYNDLSPDRKGFVCALTAPSDDAVDKCTVVRAAVKNADGSFGDTQTETFFVGSMYDHISGIGESCSAQGGPLAVISVTMDYDDLFDSVTGIYVKGDIFQDALEERLAGEGISSGEDARSLDANYKQRGRDWERAASINFFETDGSYAECVLSQDCGIRIQGNYSRSDLQKGFRLFARKEYGDNNFNYEVFDGLEDDSGETLDKFKSLTLRAGGNCAFTTKYSDTYWQTLVKDYDCAVKESRPCVVYLNGEYWGLYVLEEDYQSDYFEDHYFVNKDDVVLYKGDAERYSSGYKLDLGDIPEGESDESFHYRELYDFFEAHESLASQQDFDEFCTLVDVQSAMDYFAVEIWINNKWDWPGKNWSMWKTVNTDDSNEYADGRWRFVFYDMEFGGVSGSGDCRTNTVKEDNYKEYGLLDKNTNNPAVLCFAYLMTNDGWRSEFYEELEELGDGALSYERAMAQLDWFKACYSPLYEDFFARYEGTGSAENSNYGGYASYQCIADFLKGRADYIPNMIKWCDKTIERMK